MLVAFGALPAMLGCSDDTDDGTSVEIQSSRSYQGHANDADINNFVRVNQNSIGTRLDDCQTCHQGGTVLDDEERAVRANPCDYCHFVIHPPEGWSQLPENMAETLNFYGAAYAAAGRDADAIRDIADDDSDEDGHSNAVEIEDLRYPGDAGSHPGLTVCPVLTVTMAEIQAMPAHQQFGLANANKQQFDIYATHTGVRLLDLLAARGVDLTGATSVEILAPDGYARSFTLEQISRQYPPHRFFSGLGVEDLGSECAFVEYPAETYDYAYGDEISDAQWHILAYARDGHPLDSSYLDPTTGRIVGEGPFRNIMPPASGDDARNRPDRGRNRDTSGCTTSEWNYDDSKDHNAGSMVKAAVIIRIQPMPEGCEEFDIINGGWAMVDAEQILIYGHGVEVE